MIQTVSVFNPDATPFSPTLLIPNPDHERTDALLEFAQDTGLWRLPGYEQEPEIEEYEEMIGAFAEEYFGPDTASEVVRIEDVEDITPPSDTIDEIFNDNIDYDNNIIPYDMPPDEVPPLNWSDIVTDFQDYALDIRVEEGRMEEHMTDDYAISIWSFYVQDCWNQEMHSEVNALAGENELRGILPSTI